MLVYEMSIFCIGLFLERTMLARAGVFATTALVSLPLRYMHNPGEMCSLTDVENSIELIAEFLCRVDENTDFNPFH